MLKQILIVDDDREMCQEMSEIFRDEGYLVETALDGQRGRELLEKNCFDLLLLDLKMPKINGLQLLQIVKENEAKTKVIIITGSLFVTRFLRQEAVASAHPKEYILKLADKIMNKPFDIEALLSEARKLIGNPRVEKNHKKEETATGAKEKV
jgi:DNA-binding response OmpR family regulator